MDQENYIKKYLDSGYALIPIKRDQTKRPLVKWEEFQRVKPTESQVMDWAGKWDCDFAFVTGHDNLVCVDCDDPNLYYEFFSEFKGLVERTPSGGINFFVKSVALPKSTTKINNVALDVRGLGGYAIVPREPPAISDEEERRVQIIEGKEHKKNETPWTRRWLYFGEPDAVSDIMEVINDKIPPLEKKYKMTQNCMDYAREHMNVRYEGHGYVQTFCPFHEDEKGGTPSLTLYDDSAYCFSCKRRFSLLQIMSAVTGESEESLVSKIPDLKREPKTNSEKLMYLAETKGELVRDQNNTYYMLLKGNGPIKEIIPLEKDGDKVGYFLRQIYFNEYSCQPKNLAINDTVKYLRSRASVEGSRSKIFRRIGGDSKELWYDLCYNGKFMKISHEGTSVLDTCDINFMREGYEGEIPVPAKLEPQNIWKLFDCINIPDEKFRLLIITWLVNAVLPHTEHPILLLNGTRGSGKSQTAKRIKRILDPTLDNDNDLSIYVPKDPNHLIFQLSHSLVVVIDNVSYVDQTSSDILCQAVTGGSYMKRQLYTANTPVNISIKSRVIITSINNEVTVAGDLAERTVKIDLSRPEGKYKRNEYLDEMFETVRLDVFGAIVQLAHLYMKHSYENGNSSDSNFRMADFYDVGQFVCQYLTNGKVDFSEVYSSNLTGLSSETLETEPVSQFIFWYATEGYKDAPKTHDDFITFKDLYDMLESWGSRNNTGKYGPRWPKSPKGLSSKIKTIEPDIKRVWGIRTVRDERARKALIRFEVDVDPRPKEEKYEEGESG